MNPSPRQTCDPWQVVLWPTKRAHEWTRELVARHGDRLRVIAIGSAVRGCARPNSDLDLVVVHQGERPRLRPPPEIEVRWVPHDSIEASLKDGDDVVAWAIAFGLPLHDPMGVWSELAARWRSRLPLPSPAVAGEREARTRRLAQQLLEVGDEDAAVEQTLSMLTHRARRVLAEQGVFPLSRPELPGQLRGIGQHQVAKLLEDALHERIGPQEVLAATE